MMATGDDMRGIPRAKEPVHPTLNLDGTRRRLTPRRVKGRFFRRRRVLAYLLMALFISLPLVHVGGDPLVLLDLRSWRFVIFGGVFLASDSVLLMLLLVASMVTVFLATALFGRAWCGWACPQTVYMEFVFRPLERLLDGRAYGSRRRRPSLPRRALKQVVFGAISLVLAHIFLAYFIPIGELIGWLNESPLDHPISFGVMASTAALIYFDFSYFREQMCLLVCPYGRMQAVLQDRHSIIVGYDARRGEPRGRRKKSLSQEQLDALGHCVDCRACLRACPMGIDIREGSQLECICCTSCADACDGTMAGVGFPPGLVRYTSHAEMAGEPTRVVRPRVTIYFGVIVAAVLAMALILLGAGSSEVTVLRALASPYSVLGNGEVANRLRVKVRNRTRTPRSYVVTLEHGPAGARAIVAMSPLQVKPGRARTTPVMIMAPPAAFGASGEHDITIRVSDGEGFQESFPYRLLGPAGDTLRP